VTSTATTTATSTTTTSTGCTFTQGFWKNHPDAWVLPGGTLAVGDVNYTKAQLLDILHTPPAGNGLITLAHQLIAAKLNFLNGAAAAGVLDTIGLADAAISSQVIPPVGTGFLSPSSVSSLVDMLDQFNEGIIGPGHCSD
jgi:hypothetical protein